MRESVPQAKAVSYARSLGLLAHRNYFGPGCEIGWPDVEIFLPHGHMLLIEFKVPGKEPRKIQGYRMEQLRQLGYDVVTCYSFEDAKEYIDERVL